MKRKQLMINTKLIYCIKLIVIGVRFFERYVCVIDERIPSPPFLFLFLFHFQKDAMPMNFAFQVSSRRGATTGRKRKEENVAVWSVFSIVWLSASIDEHEKFAVAFIDGGEWNWKSGIEDGGIYLCECVYSCLSFNWKYNCNDRIRRNRLWNTKNTPTNTCRSGSKSINFPEMCLFSVFLGYDFQQTERLNEATKIDLNKEHF